MGASLIPFSDADVQHRTFPVANLLLITINALVFIYELTLGGAGLLGGGGNLEAQIFFLKWGFIPYELTQNVACVDFVLQDNTCSNLTAALQGNPFGEYSAIRLSNGLILLSVETPVPTLATIFSSMFIHGGFMHFAGNMMFLWVFGDNIEDRLGHFKYLFFYLVAGVAATLAHLAIDPQSQTPLVGASGAISGVLGAYLMIYPYNHVKVLVIFYFITVIRLPAMILLGLWFLWQLLQGVGSLGLSNQVDVAFFAHIGGFAAGLVAMAGYKLVTRQPLWPSRRHPPGEYRFRP